MRNISLIFLVLMSRTLTAQTLIVGKLIGSSGQVPQGTQIAINRWWEPSKTIPSSADGSFKFRVERPNYQEIVISAPNYRSIKVPLLILKEDQSIHLTVRLYSVSSVRDSVDCGIAFDARHKYLSEMTELGMSIGDALATARKELPRPVAGSGGRVEFYPVRPDIVRQLLHIMSDKSQNLFVRQYAAILALNDAFLQTVLMENAKFYDLVFDLVPASSWLWASDPRKIISLCTRDLEMRQYKGIPMLSTVQDRESKSPKTRDEAIELYYWDESKSNLEKFTDIQSSRYVKAELLRYMASNAQAHQYPEFAQLLQKLRSFKDIPYIAQSLRDLEPANSIAIGSKSPEFSVKMMGSNRSISPREFRGRFAVIDFWATWCGPCASTIKYLQEMYPKFSKQGVEFLSISFDKDSTSIRKFRNQYWTMPWMHAWDSSGFDGHLAKQFHVTALPKLVILSPEGKIVECGALWGQPLEKKLESLLSEYKSLKSK